MCVCARGWHASARMETATLAAEAPALVRTDGLFIYQIATSRASLETEDLCNAVRPGILGPLGQPADL